MREVMNLVFVSSKEYAQYLTVLIESIKRNNKEIFLNCYLLHKDIGDTEKEFLNKIFLEDKTGRINYISINEKYVKKIFGDNFGKYPLEACAKLFISWFVPEELERVLYLDIDMVVNGSLKELYNTPFDEKLIVACKEITAEGIPYDFIKEREHFKKFEKDTYINTGMMLLATKEIRKIIQIEDFQNAVAKLDNYLPYVEQDIHSYVYCGKVKYVDPFQYNFHFIECVFEVFEEKVSYEYAKKNMIIIHYLCKPWDWSGRFYREIYDIWWEYAAYTEFYPIWISKLIKGMREERRLRNFHDKIVLLEENGKKLSDVIKKYLTFHKYQKIGIYGAGNFGKLFLENAPKDYEYIFFDKVVRKLENYDVLEVECLNEYKDLDIVIFTPFLRENLKYEVMKKTSVKVISFEYIVDDAFFYGDKE